MQRDVVSTEALTHIHAKYVIVPCYMLHGILGLENQTNSKKKLSNSIAIRKKLFYSHSNQIWRILNVLCVS